MANRLRVIKLNPINRGTDDEIVFIYKVNGELTDLTQYNGYLTCKTAQWDDVLDDSNALFKVTGQIPDPDNEPWRMVFTLTENDTFLDPDQEYFVDIVLTKNGDTRRRAIGTFRVVGGPNNQQAGG